MNDTDAVRAVLTRLYTAWENGDAESFAAEYADDATSAVPGTFQDGRDEIRERMTARFAGPLKGTSVIDEVRGVRFIGADAAVVISRSAVLPPGESTAPDDQWVIATRVLHRDGGTWRIKAYTHCPEV